MTTFTNGPAAGKTLVPPKPLRRAVVVLGARIAIHTAGRTLKATVVGLDPDKNRVVQIKLDGSDTVISFDPDVHNVENIDTTHHIRRLQSDAYYAAELARIEKEQQRQRDAVMLERVQRVQRRLQQEEFARLQAEDHERMLERAKAQALTLKARKEAEIRKAKAEGTLNKPNEAAIAETLRRKTEREARTARQQQQPRPHLETPEKIHQSALREPHPSTVRMHLAGNSFLRLLRQECGTLWKAGFA